MVQFMPIPSCCSCYVIDGAFAQSLVYEDSLQGTEYRSCVLLTAGHLHLSSLQDCIVPSDASDS